MLLNSDCAKEKRVPIFKREKDIVLIGPSCPLIVSIAGLLLNHWTIDYVSRVKDSEEVYLQYEKLEKISFVNE